MGEEHSTYILTLHYIGEKLLYKQTIKVKLSFKKFIVIIFVQNDI